MTKKKRTTRDPDLLARLVKNMGLATRLFFDRRVSIPAKLIPLMMVLYMISPLDLVPEVFLPFGIVDDLGVFLVGLQLFINSAPREVLEEYRGSADPPQERVAPEHRARRYRRRTRRPTDDVPMVIDGQYDVRGDEDEYDEYGGYDQNP